MARISVRLHSALGRIGVSTPSARHRSGGLVLNVPNPTAPISALYNYVATSRPAVAVRTLTTSFNDVYKELKSIQDRIGRVRAQREFPLTSEALTSLEVVSNEVFRVRQLADDERIRAKATDGQAAVSSPLLIQQLDKLRQLFALTQDFTEDQVVCAKTAHQYAQRVKQLGAEALPQLTWNDAAQLLSQATTFLTNVRASGLIPAQDVNTLQASVDDLALYVSKTQLYDRTNAHPNAPSSLISVEFMREFLPVQRKVKEWEDAVRAVTATRPTFNLTGIAQPSPSPPPSSSNYQRLLRPQVALAAEAAGTPSGQARSNDPYLLDLSSFEALQRL